MLRSSVLLFVVCSLIASQNANVQIPPVAASNESQDPKAAAETVEFQQSRSLKFAIASKVAKRC
jgi:hypothetical protein